MDPSRPRGPAPWAGPRQAARSRAACRRVAWTRWGRTRRGLRWRGARRRARQAPAPCLPRPPVRPSAPRKTPDFPRQMHAYRTHPCGALRAADTGKTARLSGWIHRKRDHGGLIFIDLRDHYGLTQLVLSPGTPGFEVVEQVDED